VPRNQGDFMRVILLTLSLLLAGSVLAEEPNIRTSSETYRDWEVTCIERGDQRQCEMKQTLVNQNNQLISVLTLAKTETSDNLLVQLIMPHMVDLTAAVNVQVDHNLAFELPYRFCNQIACYVLVENNPDMIEQFKEGTQASITAFLVNGQRLGLSFSLNGFSAAAQALLDTN